MSAALRPSIVARGLRAAAAALLAAAGAAAFAIALTVTGALALTVALAVRAEAASPTRDALLADADPASLCERAIVRAAERRDVPIRLLTAVSLVESGRTREGRRRAWPWTVNVDGVGRWFDSRDQALEWLTAKRAAGARSFDVGCMQLNHYWHGDGFDSVEHMFDPIANADYAARYLSELMAETGDWMRAAGYYHSRTPAHFDRYSALISNAYAQSGGKAEMLAIARPPGELDRSTIAPRRQLATRWNGLLRLASAPLHRRAAAPVETSAPDDPTPDERPPRASAGGVSIGFAGPGASMLRAAKPMF